MRDLIFCCFFNREHPAGRRQTRQILPGKGWFTILRLYSPLEPFFTRT
jgi:hypothetical protein